MADNIPEALQPTQPVAAAPSHVAGTPIVSTTGAVDPNNLALYDHKNHTVLNVPHDDAEAYLKSGQFTLPKKARINVVDQNGDAASIDGAEAYNALQSGYRLETSDERQSRKLQEQYGSAGDQVLAGVAGAARGASFGLSDQLAIKTGLAKPETLAGLQDANPDTSTVAEMGGILAPALLTGGESLVAKTLGAGAEAASAAGQLTEKFVAKQALKAGLTNSVAKSIATKIVPSMAGSAVEGAFYGGGQLLSEDALGKADLNAENLASYIGTGALLGGAFGAAFSTAGELAPLASDAVKYVASPFNNKISQTLDQQVSAARLLGISPVQLQKLESRNPKVVESMRQYLKEDLQLGLTDTAEQLSLKNEAVRQRAGGAIGSVLKETDEVLNQMPQLKPSASSVWDGVYSKVYKTVEDLLEKDVPGMEKYQNSINSFLDDVAKLGKSDKAFEAADLQKFKKALDKMLKYEKDPGKWTVLEDMTFSARTAIRDEIDKLAGTVESNGGPAGLADRLRAANRQYSASATFGDFIEKRALKAADHGFTLSNAARDTALDLQRKLVVLGKIEQGRMKMSKLVNSAVGAFGQTTKGLSLAAQTQVPNIVNSALATSFAGDKPKKAVTKQQAYNNILENLNSFTASPTAFMEKSNRQTASIYHQAPQTSAQLDNLAMTAMTYLSTKVPRRAANMTLLSAYQPTPLPNSQELAKFARVLQAVEKPAVVLQNLETGIASREEIEVLKEVYPATFQKLQESFMHELPKLQKKMPYNRRVQLGLLLGVPADQSMQPSNVLGLQALFAEAAQPSAGAVKPTASGMKELSKDDNTKTSLQKVQSGIE